MSLIVAIDGPSASGKSTVSRKVAALLDYIYVDSGSLYRGLTWKVIQEQVSSRDQDAVVCVMENMRMVFFLDAGAVRFTIDGEKPGIELRSEQVLENVSAVAAMPPVRIWIVRQLREMKRFGNLVMEGRDIGTVVFPATPYKFYLDADSEERVRRRHRELMERKVESEIGDVRHSLLRRDAIDKGRQTAPLKKAPGAHVIETTSMSVNDVANHIVNAVLTRKRNVRTVVREKAPLLFKCSRCIVKICLKICFRYRSCGLDQVPQDGGCLIASNHASHLDPLIICCSVMHRYIRFMARNTLFKNRLFLWWSKNVGIVTVDRGRGDVAALKAAIAILKSGGVVCVFPEGTRTRDGRLQEAKGGVGFLMAKAGVPVVPVYIDGTFEAFPKGAKRIKSHKVMVSYGKPIFPSELDRFGKGKDAYKKIADLLMARIAELQL